MVQFARPPIHEIGLAVTLTEPTAFSSYDVRELHDLFRSDFPHWERAEPANGIPVELTMGVPPLSADVVSRWWFVSADQANVLQLQENYLARNWRRTTPFGTDQPYPGYTTLIQSFDEAIAKLEAKSAAEGRSLPHPRMCELLYDDLIPVSREGPAIDLTEILTFLAPCEPKMISGWTCRWTEEFAIDALPGVGQLAFEAMLAGVLRPENGELQPILRIIWRATAPGVPWAQMRAFFDAAHDYISTRFSEIVSVKTQESWKVS